MPAVPAVLENKSQSRSEGFELSDGSGGIAAKLDSEDMAGGLV